MELILIRALIDIYILILIIDVILSYLPQYKGHPFSVKVKLISDFSCAPVRRLLPKLDIPFDVSPMIVIFCLKILEVLW